MKFYNSIVVHMEEQVCLQRRVHGRIMFSIVCGCLWGILAAHAGPAWGAASRRAGSSRGAAVTTVKAVNLSERPATQVPITFGQPFRVNDVPQGDTIVAYLNGDALPTQTNVKARNSNKSVRHAIVTVLLPRLGGDASETVNLRRVPTGYSVAAQALTVRDLLRSHFNAAIVLDIAGTAWHLDARPLLENAEQKGTCKPYGRDCNEWLSGPLVSEWIVGGPVLNAHGVKNPHLAAYFAVRAYGPAPIRRVRIDVIVENDWAYVGNPHNERYGAKIYVGDKVAYRINSLDHYRQTRWHRIVWWGPRAAVYPELNSAYLQASHAVPRYQTVVPSRKLLRKVRQECKPMQRCDQSKDMGTTGAQPGIGPLPRWASVYVIDPTYRAFRWMLADDDALGSYGIHYRDSSTGRLLSVVAHPCATLDRGAEVTRCPVAPNGDDVFPRCRTECRLPFRANEAHHPSPGYVAYLVTGDWYYLEELKFWANWVVFEQNPAYRHYAQGLVVRDPLRGQAWALRTLGYAAYILPDHDPFKQYFNTVVENNIAWYNKRYTDNPKANKLHIIVGYYAIGYPNQGHKRTGTAVWQQSFFSWAVGNLADLGFIRARKLRDWISKFQIGLMTSNQYCWILASAYQVRVRDTAKSPLYTSLGMVYKKTFPEYTKAACNSTELAQLISRHRKYRYRKNVMIGYPYSPAGYVANFQIGLAADVDSNNQNAEKAWRRFMGTSVRPNYSNAPQFAIVPRRR